MQNVLINLPWQENGRCGVRAGSRWPFTTLPGYNGYIHYIPFPFFLAYTSSLLKKEKKKVKLIDCIAEHLDEQALIHKLSAINPELIVAETSTPSFSNDIKILKNIRQMAPQALIAVSGAHASVFPQQILEQYPFIDYILIGEYEITALELINYLENRSELGQVAGLAYRENNKIKIDESRQTIDNLDQLPWPDRTDVPIYAYNDGFADMPTPNAQMWASRGCPYQCIFCLWPQVIYREHKHRKRSVTDVIDEMEFLIKEMKFKAIYFDDDVFNIDQNYVIDICNEIKKRQLNTAWAAMARADIMDELTLKAMAEAGLYAIKYGIETANQDMLNLCKKNMDLAKAYSLIQSTKRMGVKVHLTFCLGLPGETRKTIANTIRFIDETKPDSLQFSFATPFPGTALHEYLTTRDWLCSTDWADYDGNRRCVLKAECIDNLEFEKIKDDLRHYFNL